MLLRFSLGTLLLLFLAGPARADELQGECLAAYGTIQCGFGCASGYGQVQCARVPGGRCLAAYGTVRCWEPTREQRRHGRRGRRYHRGRHAREFETPPVCVAEYGTTRCGYDCKADYGTIRCAKTPYGSCLAAYGTITCWDPELPAGDDTEDFED